MKNKLISAGTLVLCVALIIGILVKQGYLKPTTHISDNNDINNPTPSTSEKELPTFPAVSQHPDDAAVSSEPDITEDGELQSGDETALGSEPLVLMSQGWEFTIKNISYSSRLPEGATSDNCSSTVKNEVLLEDGTLAEGYTFVLVDLGLEKKTDDYLHTGTREGVYNVGGIELKYEADGALLIESIKYLSTNCAENPKDFYDVDFSGGYTELTVGYILKTSELEEYEWELLLNLRGYNSLNSEYEKLYESLGEEPFARVRIN